MNDIKRGIIIAEVKEGMFKGEDLYIFIGNSGHSSAVFAGGEDISSRITKVTIQITADGFPTIKLETAEA